MTARARRCLALPAALLAIAGNALAADPLPPPKGPYQPTWDSIQQQYQVPAWFSEGKFGIFMHWGLYSVPAHGSEWYVKYMYNNQGGVRDWHTQTFGPINKFGYKDFIPLFTCKDFDSDAWALLFKKAGARYVVPTAEHHDGFALWDSDLTRWDAKDMGPKRDLIGDLAQAVRKQGLKFGVSSHRMEHYSFIAIPNVPSDLTDPATQDFYWTMNHSDALYQKFLADWVARQKEVIDKYQVDMLWFDNGVNGRALDPQKLEVAAYYYNRAAEWGKPVTLSTKSTAYLSGSLLDFEREGRATQEILNTPWQVDDPIGNKFGYGVGLVYKPPELLVRRLVNTVSKNGNYLLNISPKSDGTIPQEQQDRLLAIGKWLEVNGEGIYGTKAWNQYGEGPYWASRTRSNADDPPNEKYSANEFRFTTKGDTLYVFVMDWPTDDPVISALASGKVDGKVESVTMLGHDGALAFTQDEKGLIVKFPAEKPCDYVYGLKITGLKLTPAAH
jgi:alpha-L-fucosidase